MSCAPASAAVQGWLWEAPGLLLHPCCISHVSGFLPLPWPQGQVGCSWSNGVFVIFIRCLCISCQLAFEAVLSRTCVLFIHLPSYWLYLGIMWIRVV